MSKSVKVASTSELAPGQGKVVSVDGEELALFNVDGKFYAIHNVCLHKGGPLGEGTLEGATVTCPLHGWQYDVTTGTQAMNPSLKVNAYKVTISGSDVLVEV